MEDLELEAIDEVHSAYLEVTHCGFKSVNHLILGIQVFFGTFFILRNRSTQYILGAARANDLEFFS